MLLFSALCSKTAFSFGPIYLSSPITKFPSGDLLHTFEHGQQILFLPNGDRLYFLKRFAQLDTECDFELINFESSVIYRFNNTEEIEIADNTLKAIRRRNTLLIRDSKDPRTYWYSQLALNTERPSDS